MTPIFGKPTARGMYECPKCRDLMTRAQVDAQLAKGAKTCGRCKMPHTVAQPSYKWDLAEAEGFSEEGFDFAPPIANCFDHHVKDEPMFDVRERK